MDAASAKMIANIIPYSRTKDDAVFSYEVPEPMRGEIKVGQLVKVPFGKREVAGIVIELDVPRPRFELKPILGILEKEPVLSHVQMELARFIANHYLTLLSKAVYTVLPARLHSTAKRRESKKAVTLTGSRPTDIKLTNEQATAFGEIAKAIESGKTHKFLLWGVTGSGKTEVYLKAVHKAIECGKQAVVLLPEIALTPQAIDFFAAHFGERAAVFHSKLTAGEKMSVWDMAQRGELDVVIGPRSALFTPFKNLGLIVIDEEHDNSYKSDADPRYDARRVAEKLVELCGATIVFGGATPTVETWCKAESGEYTLLKLNERVCPIENGGVVLPVYLKNKVNTELVDLRQELRGGNRSVLSLRLQEVMTEALGRGEQVLLFQNRRGTSTFVLCRDCGWVANCPNCDVPLTFHMEETNTLTCHHCGRVEAPVAICPKCMGTNVRYLGSGTQRVEQEVNKLFPSARVLRIDFDSTAKKGFLNEAYKKIKNKEIDVVIGTQIVAKGWDMPGITLTGILCAESGLKFPDFRASEEVFQMLMQVAGRCGRREVPGTVIIQTYDPENAVIQAVYKQDFEGFYANEIAQRKRFGYPPFGKLIRFVGTGFNEERLKGKLQTFAIRLKKTLRDEKLMLLGPSPSFYKRLHGKFRYQILIKTKELTELERTELHKVALSVAPEIGTDVDPTSML